ncbi:MAG TPA: hypothetical protein VEP90_24790 [Methylomirabilota bacterium]|nr:hypothetical protein [Methylomirabilota bacterium]
MYVVLRARLTQKSIGKAQSAQKTAWIMIGLEEGAMKRKRGGKGAVYITESQSKPQLRVGKRMP